MNIDGILFDKDGTLFDFEKTWSKWTSDAIEYLCGDNSAKKKLVAEALGYDPKNQSFLKSSLLIAGTAEQAAEKIAPIVINVSQHERFENRSCNK